MDQTAKEFTSQDMHGLITKAIGVATGNERLYVNTDRIPSENFSTKYHSRSRQEEFSFVLSGSGTVRLNDKSCPITKGDFFTRPSRQNITCSIYNFGDTDLMLLNVGTVEQEDTCYYPDEDIYLLKSSGQQGIISGFDFNKERVTEPNAGESRTL